MNISTKLSTLVAAGAIIFSGHDALAAHISNPGYFYTFSPGPGHQAYITTAASYTLNLNQSSPDDWEGVT